MNRRLAYTWLLASIVTIGCQVSDTRRTPKPDPWDMQRATLKCEKVKGHVKWAECFHGTIPAQHR